MSNFKKYIKRGFKYILKEYKQPIVHIDVVQKEANQLFRDNVYIVTGSTSGIGLSIAKKLIEESAFVIITGRNQDKLENAKKILGNNCECIKCDISNIEESHKILVDTYEKYGRIDGIINNAGVSFHEWDYMKVTPEGFDEQFNINLKGAYFFTQKYIDIIRKNNLTGNVIFISSEAGTMCDDLPYGLTKASINSLVKALSCNYYKEGIRVNCVAPGVTVSNMTKINRDEDLYSNSNSGRIFLPEEIAEVVCFLLSDYSKCISGEIIHTNGGNHIKKRY